MCFLLFCLEIHCSAFQVGQRMIANSTGNAYGDKVAILCESGYVLSTTVNTTRCSTDGTWFPDPGYCIG